MSLRQRGQRPSEATNEGGYYGGGGGGQQGGPYGGSGNGGAQRTPQQHRPRPSPPSSGGYPGSGGGYYGYGTPTAANANAAAPGAPGTAAPGYAGYNAATPANQPVQGAYAQTAPPAYGYGQNQGTPSSGGMQARAIQFDSAAAGSGGYGRQGAGGYGGYGGGGVSAGMGGMGGMGGSGGSNPYQKSKRSTGFGLGHVLLSILAVTLLVLTGTTIYYRNVMKNTEIELQQAKDFLDKQQRTGGRYGRDGNMDRGNDRNKKKKDWPPKKKKGQSESDRLRDMQVDLKRKTKELEDMKASHRETEIRWRTQNHLLEELQGKKQDLLKAIDHSGYILEDKKYETEKYKAMVEGTAEVEVYMKKREGALFSRIGVLEKKIEKQSLREASEWFGPGPHRVELELEYPKVDNPEADPSTWKRIRNTLTIEMAPLDQMPHTVNFFLQQVHHQLWDGCNFLNNPHHIVQVGPSYDDEDREEAHYGHFYERGLDKVSYQEYSDKFPHAQWTVGLAGRPGGPDFYINKIDNAMIHGPGGQTNKDDLHNEADPCFGKIVMEGEGGVSGKEVLDDINKVPTDREKGFAIKYPVVIISAKVLAPKENPADGWRAIPPFQKLDQQDDIMPLPEVPHGV